MRLDSVPVKPTFVHTQSTVSQDTNVCLECLLLLFGEVSGGFPAAEVRPASALRCSYGRYTQVQHRLLVYVHVLNKAGGRGSVALEKASPSS